MAVPLADDRGYLILVFLFVVSLLVVIVVVAVCTTLSFKGIYYQHFSLLKPIQLSI